MAKINFEDAVTKIIKRYLVSFGKSLASKFYTKKQVDTMILPIPAIQTDIDNLNTRSIIGSKLSFGSFDIDTSKTGVNPTLSANYKIPFKIKSGNLIVDSNGYIKLEKGKSYNLNFFATSNARFDFQFFNVTDSVSVGKTIISGSTISGSGSYSIEVTKDIYITVMVSYREGTMVFTDYCELTIQEIGRNTIIDPCENGKNINFEYGDFLMSADQSSNSSGSIITFDKLNIGNMQINNNKVLLKSGKIYEIEASIYAPCTSTGYILFGLYNETDGCYLRICEGVSTTYGAGYISQPYLSTIFNPQKDIYVSLRINSSAGITAISKDLCSFKIKEMAQPYYFNYFKDSVKTSVLFDGSANTAGTVYNLTDSLDNFDYVLIEADALYNGANTNSISEKIYKPVLGKVYSIFYWESSGAFHKADVIFKTNTTFTVSLSNKYYTSNRVFKITATGFDYDNPYQDIITTAPDAALTDSAVDSDITSIWSGVGL
ncbi:hypothetical protein B0P06_006101 [Clostridium saccharoperbutylacetonicum]|uniref:Uncharacterized protein n=1 Tax=Clostridium saccharoperbutylacetonicum N1-4(HMT) TaxID=931276 RepID=M1MP44_9CLOT|nr:hypothetical protein [Clostridium saccharoperbutylacetonicum]AGF59624.1 hypothetical protein Cspa_135p00640 [Clostridium saccharoperbutylacetonicum N1-4(HMT)]NRT64519.1 hypothetical protein [Clostridium saccharoperbutylacetonicum]NSB28994.1 hypothetical protein [Clostridium saccharoperbutylacetonicum]NSB46208.1 hypothetical protein [Clostridium saccharoperbutylacetonicum]